MNKKKNQLYTWVWSSLLIVLLCGCTAKMTETDGNGLPPHISVNLKLPESLRLGNSNDFSVQVSKSNIPLEHAETAEFVIWPESDKASAVTLKADERSPGLYAVSYVIEQEGLYLIQSRIKFADAQVMPTKRFAIGDHAIERLAEIESYQHTDADAPDPTPASSHH